MESNFSACLRHVLAMEGGFSNDPSDHGGATNWGITAATLAHWRGHKVTEADVRAIPARKWLPNNPVAGYPAFVSADLGVHPGNSGPHLLTVDRAGHLGNVGSIQARLECLRDAGRKEQRQVDDASAVNLVLRFWREVWSPPYNIDAIDQLLAEDFTCVNAGVAIVSRAAFKEWVRAFGSRIGNVRLEPLDTFANVTGTSVASRWRATGTNQGIFGLPADGTPIEFSGMSIWHVRDNRLVHHWIERSAFELFQKLRI